LSSDYKLTGLHWSFCHENGA